MNQPASNVLPPSFTPQKREKLFREIIKMYDLVDDTLAVIQREGATNREAQLQLATPFVTQVTNSANILSTFYAEVVNKGQPITPDIQDTMESAFRNVFHAYKDFIDGAENKLIPTDPQAAAAAAIEKAKGQPAAADALAKSAIEKARSNDPVTQVDETPLDVRFQKRAKGMLQNRAIALQQQIPPNAGGDAIEEVARIGRHTAQLVLDIQAENIPLVRSYGAAVPALGKSSEMARQISARQGLGGDVEMPSRLFVQRLT